MAREQQDREDLFAEATALVERVELAIHAEPPVVVGFHRAGGASIYFGADPAYHFNAAGELRRAYRGDLLYKADRGALASLRRERTGDSVNLVRRDLTPDETETFLAEARGRLCDLANACESGTARVLRQSPETIDVLGKVRQWLATLPGELPIARSPGVER